MKRLVLLAVVTASSAASAAPQHSAWLWADQPAAASYTPHLSYQGNSSGGTNTIARIGTGVYVATLPGIGAQAGVVHVTAYGTGSHTCKVERWVPAGLDQLVYVRCFDNAGTAADSRFTMSYANPITRDGTMLYLWADQPTAADYTPNPAYSTPPSRVTRVGVGDYRAELGFLIPAGGHAQVTAYGTSSDRCRIVRWQRIAPRHEQQIHVRCFTVAGAPVDARFTLTYTLEADLLGGLDGAYALADRPTTASYIPHALFRWDGLLGTSTAMRSSTGVYAVTFPAQDLFGGSFHVTGHGVDPAATHCKIASWSNLGGAQVRCFGVDGNPADAQFTIGFIAE